MTESKDSNASFDRFQLWKEYEAVTMHFNDLIIKLRSQSLGAVAALATLAGVVAKSDAKAEAGWGLLAGAFLILSIFWVAVWVLDLGYYNRLLAGAVDALLIIESESSSSLQATGINLSTKIEEAVAKGCVRNNAYRVGFYVLVLFALLVGLGASAYKFTR